MVKTRKSRRMINGENYPLNSDVFQDVRKQINKNIKDTERNINKPIISKPLRI